MKLIRLTSEDSRGIFDCNFNDGIEIPPNSTVALQSVSTNLESSDIDITEDNNGIEYMIKEGYIKQVNLTPFTYTVANADSLLTDITDTLNNNAAWEVGLNKIIGLEWKCHHPGSAVQLGYQVSRMGEYQNATEGNTFELNNVNRATTNNGTWGKESGQAGGLDFTTCAINSTYLSRGNGLWRCRVGRLDDGGDINTSGFYWCLTTDAVQPARFEEKDVSFGIYATNNGGVLQYYTVKDGVRTLNALTPTTPVNPPGAGYLDNDFLEIAIDGGLVKLNVYQGAAATKTTMASYTYNNEPLFPAVVFIGGRGVATCNNVRWTPSPWASSLTSSNISDLGTSLPPRPQANPIQSTENFVRFDSLRVANYLGFEYRRLPAGGTTTADDELKFTALKPFAVGLNVNSYLIQLLNLKVDSYDSLKEQRENLIAVVPNTNLNGELDYSPPYPIFLSLMNPNVISVRNIKARIVNNDYTSINMFGLGQINLIIQ